MEGVSEDGVMIAIYLLAWQTLRLCCVLVPVVFVFLHGCTFIQTYMYCAYVQYTHKPSHLPDARLIVAEDIRHHLLHIPALHHLCGSACKCVWMKGCACASESACELASYVAEHIHVPRSTFVHAPRTWASALKDISL